MFLFLLRNLALMFVFFVIQFLTKYLKQESSHLEPPTSNDSRVIHGSGGNTRVACFGVVSPGLVAPVWSPGVSRVRYRAWSSRVALAACGTLAKNTPVSLLFTRATKPLVCSTHKPKTHSAQLTSGPVP